jgi:hypothetical protein
VWWRRRRRGGGGARRAVDAPPLFGFRVFAFSPRFRRFDEIAAAAAHRRWPSIA